MRADAIIFDIWSAMQNDNIPPLCNMDYSPILLIMQENDKNAKKYMIF